MGLGMNIQVLEKSAESFSDQYWQVLSKLGKPFDQRQNVFVRTDLSKAINFEDEALIKIAIVGTRRPTSYGLRFISNFVEELSKRSFCESSSGTLLKPVIVSGGALGVDAWAHECALKYGLATESWVVGPIENPNPRSHKHLYEKIVCAGGAIYCPSTLQPQKGQSPHKSDWVVRNAFLVARSSVVVVAEAQDRSGTWSSVRWASKLGIPVFALPGSIDSSASQGTNSMISGGYAHPIQSAVKLIDDLVVWGIMPPYNIDKGEGCAQNSKVSGLEDWLCRPGGLSISDLPGLSEQMGLKLEELCEFLLKEVREGKLRRVGNGFERRG